MRFAVGQDPFVAHCTFCDAPAKSVTADGKLACDGCLDELEVTVLMSDNAINRTCLLNTIDIDNPSVGQVAEALEDGRGLTNGEAYQRVEEAIAAGYLVEDANAGMFGAVRLPETDDEDPKPDDKPAVIPMT